MDVEFRRTGERRYAVTVHRDGLHALEFGGPGYDRWMPHDLQHLIVESELGLARGIFGFMAAGGHAGARTRDDDPRSVKRRRVKSAKRDMRRLRNGERADADASERAAYVCWYEWLRRSADRERRRRAASMAETAARMLGTMPEAERRALSDEAFARICARMDELSARWCSLGVGDAFTVAWTVRRVR
jgi:hypothetical protein